MTNCYSILSQLGVLAVTGEKASEFLQGQTTCDLRQLTTELGLRGACCNNKGRVLATFVVAAADNGILLILNAAIIPSLMKHLQKYAMLHRVTLENQSPALSVLHYSGTNTNNAPNVGQIICRLDTPHPNEYIVLPHDHAPPFKKLLDANSKEITEDEWHCQRLRDRFPFIYPQTAEEFTPHQLGLPHLGFVSYEKGCYTGQEIIARMHYRGQDQVKQTLHQHEFPNTSLVEIGSPIALGDTPPSAILVDYAPSSRDNVLGLVLY